MTSENNSTNSYLKEDDIEKDRRRINLLNDPNYGIVLCFLDKFRSLLDLPNYPLQLFEDHLINYQEQNPSRLIDFHFILLKRLSLAKNAQHDKFNSIITKFTSRFDLNDSEHLKTTGYLQADVNIKIRILKNLLENQFDLNQTFKNILLEKSSREIKSLPIGRDRFGASYWFFMDNNCFVRLFREDINSDRTWTNIVKNRDELEKFIALLITDFVVRTRFSDWTVDYDVFSSLLPTNEFEQYYSPFPGNVTTLTDDGNVDVPMKRKRGRPKRSTISIKEEEVEPPTKIKSERPRRLTNSLYKKIDIEVKEEIEPKLDEDEKLAVPIKRKRGRPKKSLNVKTQTLGGRKRKLAVEDYPKAEDHSQEDEISIDDMSLAIRRSSLTQAPSIIEPVSKTPSQKHPINTKPKVSRRRKTKNRRNFDDHLCLSTSSSDEHIDYLSEDDDDYQSQIDIDDHLFELDEEDNNPPNQQFRTAKTAQTSTIITTCYICSKSDRPEVLLLCDNCNDAYHLECLHPKLLSVPDDDWFCPLCEHKNLSECLINKLKELIINLNISQTKQSSRSLKKNLSQRKIKIKAYSSDESITASESEHENIINGDESMLSTSQINENSNLSSCYFDDEKYNISQRGRHRRTRFDMKQMLHDEYDTNFSLQLPKKITRLLHRHDRSIIKNDSPTKLLTTRLSDTSQFDLNEKLGSPLVYVNSDGNSRQIKSAITNSKQTLKIVRRWNDVQRRSRLKATNMKALNDTITSDYVDENSGFGPDDISPPFSNDSHSNTALKYEDTAINRAKISLVQPPTLISIDKCSSRNIVKKSDANFDRLTRDIQIAVSEAHLLPITTVSTNKTTDQQHGGRVQKRKFSPYTTKFRFPLLLPEIPDDAYNIFKSKESSIPTSDSGTNDLSNIILTPSSSSPLLDVTDDQTTSITNN